MELLEANALEFQILFRLVVRFPAAQDISKHHPDNILHKGTLTKRGRTCSRAGLLMLDHIYNPMWHLPVDARDNLMESPSADVKCKHESRANSRIYLTVRITPELGSHVTRGM